MILENCVAFDLIEGQVKYEAIAYLNKDKTA